MFFYDTTFVILIPAMLLAMIADSMVKTNFNKYSRIRNSRNMTGAEAARRILDINGLYDVEIRAIPGNLTDNYNPRNKVLSLSQNVYNSTSISAVGVACHEVGHAIQHAKGYFPLKLRNSIVPITNFASRMTWPLILIGLLLLSVGNYSAYYWGDTIFNIGAFAFVVIILFHLITLPVEFNASRRAIQNIKEYGMLSEDEVPGACKVLRAAALTYVAALAIAVGNLLRILAIRGRRD